jgi:transposase
VVRHGDTLRAGDGREVAVDDAVHLAPTVPSKIVAVHLNYSSRVQEFGTALPPAPTYFHKPTSSLNSHRGAVVRPQRCKVVRLTHQELPADGSTQWSTRTMAARVGIGKDKVARIWADHQLRPWRVDTFKVSNDPRFEEKLVDVVGLYLNPPARAVVFSFDEKTSCQALDRTQPSLPMKAGRAGTMTHDYKRHGTIDLFAAMNLATGEVLTDLRKGHTGADVLRFFKQIDASVPRGLSIHVILDNLSAHSTPEIKKWLAHKDRRRWHLHFTPTSSSWLNLIERWFKELTDRRLRRGVFTSVADLTDAISTWAGHWNIDPKPFIWKATAEDILTKVQRGRATLHQIKSPTDH